MFASIYEEREGTGGYMCGSFGEELDSVYCISHELFFLFFLGEVWDFFIAVWFLRSHDMAFICGY